MMKADVLSGFETLEVATEYLYNDKPVDHLPYDVLSGKLSAVYSSLKGWNSDLTGMKDISELPEELENYTKFIEEQTKTPVVVISVGPDREQTLIRKNIFG